MAVENSVITYKNKFIQPSVAGSVGVTLSPSSLETLLTCPLKYYYQSLISLKSGKLGVAQAQGILIHSLMQDYFQTSFNQGEAGFKNVLSTYQLKLSQPVNPRENSLPVDLSLLTLLEREQLNFQFMQAIQGLLEGEFFKQITPEKYEVVASEKWLMWKNPFGLNGLNLSGRVDLILRDRLSQALLLLDFKTSKRSYSNFELSKNIQKLEQSILKKVEFDEEQKIPSSLELQLPLYALMMEHDHSIKKRPQLMGLQFIRSIIYAPNHLVSVSTQMIDQQLPLYQKLLENALKGLNSTIEFQAKGKASDCRLCDYQSICTKSKADEDSFDEDFGA